MSEDMKEEMRKLRQEMDELKERLKTAAHEDSARKHGFYVDIGGPVSHYVDDVMEGVAEGVHGELEKSIFIGPRGLSILRREPHHGETEDKANFPKMAAAMSALGHEHRLRILEELMRGGMYINELQEKLSEITTSTLSSHLNVLEEAGFVVQEKVRGRYLITMPGRTAYKMTRQIARFLEARGEG